MKKIIGFVIVLAVIFFAFQYGIILLKDSHKVEYQIRKDDKIVSISEEYTKTKEDEYYFFNVAIEKQNFVFDTSNRFNKQKKVISDIKIYQEDELTCISPIYIKNNELSEIFCNINNNQYAYTFVKKEYDLEKFIQTLDNYSDDKYKIYNDYSRIDNNKIYKNNLYDDETILIYEYNEIAKITKTANRNIRFANYDIYDNEIGTLIDKYYILPEYNNKPEYSRLMLINIVTEEISYIDFDKAISTNIYINGVVDNKLYLFDKSNLNQYEIDPIKKTYRIIGDKNTAGQYYDGEWSNRNIYDFKKQNLVFNKLYPIKANYVKAFETNKYYYYYNNDNEFYKVYKKELDKPIFLFQYDNVEEVKIVEDKIYFINNRTLYRYDDSGLKRLIVNNEFKYNYENIYSIYY